MADDNYSRRKFIEASYFPAAKPVAVRFDSAPAMRKKEEKLEHPLLRHSAGN